MLEKLNLSWKVFNFKQCKLQILTKYGAHPTIAQASIPNHFSVEGVFELLKTDSFERFQSKLKLRRLCFFRNLFQVRFYFVKNSILHVIILVFFINRFLIHVFDHIQISTNTQFY